LNMYYAGLQLLVMQFTIRSRIEEVLLYLCNRFGLNP
jgi:hypothetical protein